jgi:tetratricopeptide (TPR) repeat protein
MLNRPGSEFLTLANYQRSILAIAPMLAAMVLLLVSHLHLWQVWNGELLFGSSLKNISGQQIQTAESELAAALQYSPDNAHYYAHQALLRERSLQRHLEPFPLLRPPFSDSEREQLRAAVHSYQKVLEINPSDDHAYHNLGWLYWFLGQEEQGLACLQKAVELDNSIPLYHLSMGMQHELRGDETGADDEFGTALRLSPSLLDSRFYRDLRARLPRRAAEIVANVIRQLEIELQAGFSPVIAGKLGRLYLDTQPGRAVELLNRAILILPNLSRPWANLASYFEQHGDEAFARQCYEKAVFIDGSDALSWYRLGKYYDRQNRTPDAARCYQRAVNIFLKPESIHSGRVRRVYLSRFTMFDDVIPNGLSRYVASNFDFPFACQRLSDINRATGDLEEAKRFADLGRKYAQEIDFSTAR